MVLSCSGPITLALLNKQLSNSSFSLFFSCHAAPFLDKCFFYQTNTCHRRDTYLLEFEDYLPHHNKNKQDQTNQFYFSQPKHKSWRTARSEHLCQWPQMRSHCTTLLNCSCRCIYNQTSPLEQLNSIQFSR